MSEYSYDDSGDNTTIFLLSGLCLYLIPATYTRLSNYWAKPVGPVRDGSPFYELTQKKKTKKLEEYKPHYTAYDYIYLFAWVLTIVLLWRASGITVLEQEVWSPYKILGLEEGATPKEIKHAYRSLSLSSHPDKNPDKADANEIYMEIVKAHQTLTDDETRENWEKYGHPDGKRSTSYGIALPEFLISDTYKWVVLAAYFLAIMVFMPVVVAQWWWNSKRHTRDRILRQTINLYYQFLRPQMTTAQIIDVLTASVEFKDEVPERDTDAEQIKGIIELLGKTNGEGKAEDMLERFSDKATFDAPYCLKARTLLTAHMFRLTDLPEEMVHDQQKILSLVPALIQGMVNMASLRKWAPLALQCMRLNALIRQAFISEQQPPVFQFPGITTDIFKRLILGDTKTFNVETVLDADKEVLKDQTKMSDSEFKDVITVAENIPFVHVETTPVCTGEEQIYAQALVTVKVKLTRGNYHQVKAMDANPQTVTKIDKKVDDTAGLRRRKGEKDTKSDTDEGYDSEDDGVVLASKKDKIFKDAAVGPIVYAPYYPQEVQESWWVFLADNRNQMLSHALKVDDLITEKELDIIIPPFPKAGTYKVTLCLFSDSYVGSNKTQEVEVVVVDPPAPQVVSSAESEDEGPVGQEGDVSEVESELESDFEDEDMK
eukprot:CFRG7903T1